MKIFLSGTISETTVKRNRKIAEILRSFSQFSVVLPQENNDETERVRYERNLEEIRNSDVFLLFGDDFGICSSSELGRAKELGKPVIFFTEEKQTIDDMKKHVMIKFDVDAIMTPKEEVFQFVKTDEVLASKKIMLTNYSRMGTDLIKLLSQID